MATIEAHLIENFILLNQFFQKHQIRYALIGGMAAGFWGEPRYTQDMDFTVVHRTGLQQMADLLKKEGYLVDMKGDSQAQITGKGNAKFHADLILAETDYQDWVVQRATPIKMFDVAVPICSAEDLIILKLIANRRQDLLDIENILKKQVSLDRDYLKKWFAVWQLTELFEKEFGKLDS